MKLDLFTIAVGAIICGVFTTIATLVGGGTLPSLPYLAAMSLAGGIGFAVAFPAR